jgi:hypothetical protein
MHGKSRARRARALGALDFSDAEKNVNARLRRCKHHGQAADALGPVNQDSFDIGSGGRAADQYRISRGLEPRIAICVMQVADDVAGIEQCDQMLRQKAKRIDLQFRLG